MLPSPWGAVMSLLGGGYILCIWIHSSSWPKGLLTSSRVSPPVASLGLKYHRLRALGLWASSQTSWLIKAASLLASAESSRTWSKLLHQQEDDGIFSPPLPACPSTYEAATWGRQVQGDPPWARGKVRVSKICLSRTQTAKPLEQDWPGMKEKSFTRQIFKEYQHRARNRPKGGRQSREWGTVPGIP